MTRCYGDLIAASVGVIYNPDITTTVLTDEHKTLLMGSDGLWEFTATDTIMRIVSEAKGKSLEQCCQDLITEATKAWRKEDDVVDDITVILVELVEG